MASIGSNPLLRDLETKMAAYHLRGQWQTDSGKRRQNLRKGANGTIHIDPAPACVPHKWQWKALEPLLASACDALQDSLTARRALILSNPTLNEGTTQNLSATLQIVRSGEIAWAHRHAMNALRFTIQGNDKVYTVVNGRPLIMEPYDLILTPAWCWHDHHNESDKPAIWLDALDVPFTLAINQIFYEDLGSVAQERVSEGDLSPTFRADGPHGSRARPYRYPWKETLRALERQKTVDPCHGQRIEYVDPTTGGPILSTIGCHIQILPPGFEGHAHRRTSSAIVFVVEGEGCTVFADRALDWQQHDSLALPNWTWHRHINRSRQDRAIILTLSDIPILSAFGYYREERGDCAPALPLPGTLPAAE